MGHYGRIGNPDTNAHRVFVELVHHQGQPVSSDRLRAVAGNTSALHSVIHEIRQQLPPTMRVRHRCLSRKGGYRGAYVLERI